MSFLSKIFGSKSKNHVSLVIHDSYLEVLQLDGQGHELIGVNRISLEEGIVKKGEIRRESDFQEALTILFEGAQPNPIQPDHLHINIPFKQIYPFVKTFSSHSSEEHMQMALNDVISSQAPFDMDELAIGYRQQIGDIKMHYGALAYPKRWQSFVNEACKEMGYGNLHFVPEPLAQMSLSGNELRGHFALFSWQEGTVFLSLFYHGLLYDSFSLKSSPDNPTAVFEEFKEANKEFQSSLSEKISELYFASFPQALRDKFKEVDDLKKWNTVYLRETDSFVSNIIPAENYSTTLIGLAIYSLKQAA